MALEDKGTHMLDPETGGVYAKVSSPGGAKKKGARRLRPKMLWVDIKHLVQTLVFTGHTTMERIAKQFKIPVRTVLNRSSKEKWREEWERQSQLAVGLAPKQPSTLEVTANALADTGNEFRIDAGDLLARTAKMWRKKKPEYAMKNADPIAKLVTTGAKVFGFEKEDKAAVAPTVILNVDFLMHEGEKTAVAREI